MKHKWVFKLDPYDRKAKNVIAYLRASLSPNYILKVRGRGARTKPGDDAGIPLSRAQRVVVYVFGKDGTELLTTRVKVEKKKKAKAPGGRLRDLLNKLEKDSKSGKSG